MKDYECEAMPPDFMGRRNIGGPDMGGHGMMGPGEAARGSARARAYRRAGARARLCGRGCAVHVGRMLGGAAAQADLIVTRARIIIDDDSSTITMRARRRLPWARRAWDGGLQEGRATHGHDGAGGASHGWARHDGGGTQRAQGRARRWRPRGATKPATETADDAVSLRASTGMWSCIRSRMNVF